MIPRIIHQMWKDAAVPPRFVAWQDGWRRLHPGWDYRLWTDATLDGFVRRHYPAYAGIYRGYREPIMRADMARYLLLEHFGGVYADLDAECLASFAPLLEESRLVLGQEPPSHWTTARVQARGFSWLAGNAVMASPAGHPFWAHLRRLLLLQSDAHGPLDATGPFLLTQAVIDYPDQAALRLLPPAAFNPADRAGQLSAEMAPLARHHWSGTWVRHADRRLTWTRLRRRLRAAWRQRRQERSMSFREATRGLDRGLLARVAPAEGSVAVLVPVRDAATTLPALFDGLQALDWPRERLAVAFLEGGSQDRSAALLRAWCAGPGRGFAKAQVFQEPARYDLTLKRWDPKLQRARRGGLAAARNALLRQGLGAADWALWIDADVIDFPPDVLRRLLASGARLATPHCVRQPGGRSFDLNTFVTDWEPPPEERGRHLLNGLYQPPRGLGRTYLHELRYLPRVRVDGVGATMLLVDGNLHRAGLVFPERPYKQLIETEALAALAADLGIESWALPQVEILHAENG